MPTDILLLLLNIPEAMPYMLEVWNGAIDDDNGDDDDDSDIRIEGSHNPCIDLDAANIEGSS